MEIVSQVIRVNYNNLQKRLIIPTNAYESYCSCNLIHLIRAFLKKQQKNVNDIELLLRLLEILVEKHFTIVLCNIRNKKCFLTLYLHKLKLFFFLIKRFMPEG